MTYKEMDSILSRILVKSAWNCLQ